MINMLTMGIGEGKSYVSVTLENLTKQVKLSKGLTNIKIDFDLIPELIESLQEIKKLNVKKVEGEVI